MSTLLRASHPDCVATKLLDVIYREGQPQVNEQVLQEVHERLAVLFFPQKSISKLFTNVSQVQALLECDHCKKWRERTKAKPLEDKRLSEDIAKPENVNLHLILAILIYLGEAPLIRLLGSSPNPSVSSVPDILRNEEYMIGKQYFESEENTKIFCQNYDYAKPMFNVQKFRLMGTTRKFPSLTRFPFLNDELHKRGGFGEIRKFNIHEDYLDDKLRMMISKYCKDESTGFQFARKVMRVADSTSEVENEMANIEFITSQAHDHIIDVACFYEWKGDISFVFPFVERNLHDVLHGDWSPTHQQKNLVNELGTSWLWRQTLGIADALKVIHSPEPKHLDVKVPLLGFHFDLKPANILVTNDGVLKITDFGQSLIKPAPRSGDSKAAASPGAFRYRPPEVRWTLEMIGQDRSHSKTSRKYDIWSLACIMLEIIIRIRDGAQKLENFESESIKEDPGIAFHNNGGKGAKLKSSVARELQKFKEAPHRPMPEARYDVHLCKVVELLQEMLSIEPEKRPSASSVVLKLREIDVPPGPPEDELTYKIRTMDIVPTYAELGYRISETRESNEFAPFNSLEGISIEILLQEHSGGRRKTVIKACQMRLFITDNRERLSIRRGYRMQDNDELKLDGNTVPRATALYLPIYLFKPNNLACAFLNSDYNEAYHFSSKNDLYRFQNAVVSHCVVNGTDSKLKSIKIHKGMHQDISDEDEPLFIQLWDQLDEPVGKVTNRLKTGRQRIADYWTKPSEFQSTRRDLISARITDRKRIRAFIFRPQKRDYFHFPFLRDRKFKDGKYREAKVDPASCWINLQPAPNLHRFSYGHSKASDQQWETPGVPLEPTILEANYKAMHVDIEFRDYEEKTTFIKALKGIAPHLWVDAIQRRR